MLAPFSEHRGFLFSTPRDIVSAPEMNTAKERIALRLQRLTAPRGDALRCLHADLSEVTCIDAGDHVELLHGIPSRGDMAIVAIPAPTAARLGWFLLWNHFCLGTWFGLRNRLQDWSLTVIVDAEQDRVFNKWRKVNPDAPSVSPTPPHPRRARSTRL